MPTSSFSTSNWRAQLRLNNRRSYMVMGSFVLIYGLVGLLVDTALCAGYYPQASLTQLLLALLTCHLVPIATLVTLGIALISLGISFSFHDRLMLLGTQYREITPNHAQSLQETQLYHVVEEMKVAANLRYMPKIYVMEADHMNAFASGYSEKSALVAITRGLMEKLDRSELQAVMAHELSHIRHMDIKLTLMASVLSNLMLIFIDLLFHNMLFNQREDNRSRRQLVPLILALRWLLPLTTALLTLYLSRTREYMADAGCVALTRENAPLARALLKIQGDYQRQAKTYHLSSSRTAHESIRRQAYIFDPTQAGIATNSPWTDLFSTHPSIEKRLAALGITLTEKQT